MSVVESVFEAVKGRVYGDTDRSEDDCQHEWTIDTWLWYDDIEFRRCMTTAVMCLDRRCLKKCKKCDETETAVETYAEVPITKWLDFVEDYEAR